MYHQDEDEPEQSPEQYHTTENSILEEEDKKFFDSGKQLY